MCIRTYRTGGGVGGGVGVGGRGSGFGGSISVPAHFPTSLFLQFPSCSTSVASLLASAQRCKYNYYIANQGMSGAA